MKLTAADQKANKKTRHNNNLACPTGQRSRVKYITSGPPYTACDPQLAPLFAGVRAKAKRVKDVPLETGVGTSFQAYSKV